ncbi:uncharacterized protein DMAD_09571 [Drosophila madeirensis]|uniref:Uncharacterized protein n=1 Tax=Drosophila madeirensis TaxID=30013 RepID=A0AAU9F1N1_DROMD
MTFEKRSKPHHDHGKTGIGTPGCEPLHLDGERNRQLYNECCHDHNCSGHYNSGGHDYDCSSNNNYNNGGNNGCYI